jgi:hypothetical protein
MGTVDHREQSLFGTSLSANSYNATAIYSNALLGGFVTLVGGVNENTLDVNNSHSLGYLGSIGYSRKVQRWEFTESVNYARNQQTFLINYMSTSYGFNSSVGRRIGQYAHFSLGAGGSKSRLNSITGSDSTTQNYTVALSVKYIGVNAGYSKSSGDAILTAGGLVPTPVPLPVVNPANIIVYGGKAYSFGIGANPMRHMTISASYAKSLNDTASQFLNSNNHMDMFTTRMEYHFRMINFDSGYSRLRQGFSLSGTPPIMIGSFYVGISRWIDFF